MPRHARQVSKTGIYHLMVRGISPTLVSKYSRPVTT